MITPTPIELSHRKAEVKRITKETQVSIQLNLDGDGQCQIDTGIAFFDHMLNQLGYHGLFDLQITAKGDLEIDEHHTMEDIGLALGEAFSTALQTRAGITRMGDASIPMDESLAFTCVDFSGRPYCVIQTDWQGFSVGSIPTSLIDHFWESFAIMARCNLHIRVLYGKDNHHMAEAMFKSAGRAICSATRIDPRRSGSVPSTKGTIQVLG
jgi:imidazoleglycerol-phosphate dehydratase